MSNFQIFKVNSIPAQLVPNAVYLKASAEPGFFEIHVANADGTATRKTPTLSDFELMPQQASVFKLTIKDITSNYTLALVDGGGKTLIQANHATGLTITVPTNANVEFQPGTSIMVAQAGVGQITFVGEAGVTILTPETLITRKQEGCVSLIKIATNVWRIEGNLETA